jgi:trans-aconitate 2-methyltransferase
MTDAVKPVWDPQQYEKFGDERSRPFRELVERIDHPAARTVVDLGCGTGALTAELAVRWPGATIDGIDSSAEMVTEAKTREIEGRLRFVQGDLREWRPDEPVDVLVSNATLQWVPGHLDLLGDLASYLAPAGVLAFQVPGNFEEPSHRLLAELRASDPWKAKLAGQPERPAGVSSPSEYLGKLTEAGLAADVWETTYMQVLQGPNAVLEWMKGTALRPTLTALDRDDAAEFLDELGRRLALAYPESVAGTVLPFRRIFAVGRRPGQAVEPPPGGSAIAGLDHVQIAIPAGGEPSGRAFYVGLLGLTEQPKPPALAARGGCWFTGHRLELHLGVDPDFRPATKAHVAVEVRGLDSVANRLSAAGHEVLWDDELAPRRRFYTSDPFGNRLELLGARAGGSA